MNIIPHESPKGSGQTELSTSFVAKTPEVQAMREKLRQNPPVPIFWYELAQNTLDYNDNSQGRPQIVCEMENKKRMSLSEYLQTKERRTPARIEFRNYIKSGSNGMTPDDVVHIEHGGGEGTLGQHGRGLTVASTLALSDKLCYGIEYESVDSHGRWKGAGKMQTTRADQKSPHFVLEYSRFSSSLLSKEKKGAETVVTVVKPSNELLDSLRNLPQFFLPVNQEYQFSRFSGSEPQQRIPNEFTFAVQQLEGVDVALDEDARREIFEDQHIQAGDETPRIEILPEGLINDDLSNSMYVGGLRLDATQVYYNFDVRSFALPWSIYGFEKTRYASFRVTRSHDSSKVEGRPLDVIATALQRCPQIDVHAKILKSSMGTRKCVEGSISKYSFEDIPNTTKDAIRQAWDKVLQEQGKTSENVLITANESMVVRGKAANKDVMLINSEGYVFVLKSLGVKLAEDEFKITQHNQSTGESINVTRKTEEEYMKDISANVLRLFANSKGKKTRFKRIESEGLSIFVEGSRFGEHFSDLDIYVRDIAIDATAFLRSIAECNVYADNGIQRELFSFSNDPYYEKSRANIHFEHGQSVSEGEKGVTIEIKPIVRNNPTLAKLFQQIDREVKQFIKPNGDFDIESYNASIEHDKNTLTDRLREEREALARLKKEQEETNKALAKIKLKDGSDVPSLSLIELLRESSLGTIAAIKGVITPDATYKGVRNGYFVEGNSADGANLHVLDFGSGKPEYPEKRVKIKKLAPGLNPLVCPIGYRPIAYSGNEGSEVSVYEVGDEHTYMISVDKPVNGMEIFFEPSLGRAEPYAYETMELANLKLLIPEWQDLIKTIKDDKDLSDMGKLSIISTAWKKAFSYTGLPTGKDYDDQINNARGNCIDASQGHSALVRFVGIPSRTREGRVGQMGRIVYDPGHMWDQVYIDGFWRDFEPQDAKFVRGRKLSNIPDRYRSLLKKIPKGSFSIGVLPEAMRNLAPKAILTSPLTVGGVFLANRLIDMVGSARIVNTQTNKEILLFDVIKNSSLPEAVAVGAGAALVALLTKKAYDIGKKRGIKKGKKDEIELIKRRVEEYMRDQKQKATEDAESPGKQ